MVLPNTPMVTSDDGCSGPMQKYDATAMLERYARDGFAPFVAEWQRRHALQKKPVRVLLPDGSVAAGEVVGVDASGALVLDHRGRRIRFVSGEVSLRRG